MNVYDFDKTIYDGDSTTDFYFYLLKKYPKTWLNLPRVIYASLFRVLGIYDKTQMKEKFYQIFKYVDVEKEIKEFWDKNIHKIYPYYLQRQKEDDLVISASFEADIVEACSRLGIKNVIASRVDINSGKCLSKNCHGQEKVNRFIEEYGKKKIEEFYSDSFSDTPLAKISKKAYLIKKGEVIPWPIDKL